MKPSTAKLILFLMGMLLLTTFNPAQAAQINTTPDGVAIKGYDTVAYFTMGKPVPGEKEFQYTWQNAKWLFSSQQHLQLFQENPGKYAPQYGGY